MKANSFSVGKDCCSLIRLLLQNRGIKECSTAMSSETTGVGIVPILLWKWGGQCIEKHLRTVGFCLINSCYRMSMAACGGFCEL